jgi:hypothetical protein
VAGCGNGGAPESYRRAVNDTASVAEISTDGLSRQGPAEDSAQGTRGEVPTRPGGLAVGSITVMV